MIEETYFKEKQINDQIEFTELEEIRIQLANEIQKIFDGTGMYFQILSRTKTSKSIASKLNSGKYENDGKHIQDIVGIRIVFYYFDDIKIAKNILEHVFNIVDDWSESNNDVDKFKAIKRNGVFNIPEECFKLYTEKMWDLPIDKTFEIQLRTMFFEGWHEIEHDMRYKKSDSLGDLWHDNYGLSRMLNCVLANLELCDWSLVNLFDQLADSHYNAGKLELMIKSKFRLKMKDEKLDSHLLAILKERPELAYRFFGCTRNQLIHELLKHEAPVITPSYIIRMLNDAIVKDEEIASACEKIQWKKSERLQIRNEFVRLKRYPAYNYDVTIKHNDSRALEEEAQRVASIIYRWAYDRFKNVFNMSENVCDFQSEAPGYKLAVKVDTEKMKFSLYAMHMDVERSETLWNVYADYYEVEGRLHFSVKCNCDSRNSIPKAEIFKRPYFVKEIYSQFGFEDIVVLDDDIKWLRTKEEYKNINELINNKNRKLPVIVVCQYGEEKDNTLIKISSFVKIVCEYAHIYCVEKNLFEQYSSLVNISSEKLNGSIAVFWKNGVNPSNDFYGSEQIMNSQFDFNRFVFSDGQIFDKAFRRKLLQIIKEHNRLDG